MNEHTQGPEWLQLSRNTQNVAGVCLVMEAKVMLHLSPGSTGHMGRGLTWLWHLGVIRVAWDPREKGEVSLGPVWSGEGLSGGWAGASL